MTRPTAIHLCSFDSGIPSKQKRDYPMLRAALLAVGRFSVFEATESQRVAKLYTKLSDDPSLLITNLGYPWTAVRLRTADDPQWEPPEWHEYTDEEITALRAKGVIVLDLGKNKARKHKRT